MPFSKKFIDDIRAAANIVEIVGETIELRAFPGDRHKGLCPFHDESSPSFSVDKNLYYCFGCHEGGDVIRFIERSQKITFGAAVRFLANRYGIVDDDSQPCRPSRPAKRKVSGIRQPRGYVAPKEPFVAVYDLYAAELFEDLDTRHYDCFLTLGIVPAQLIEELGNDVCMSHLRR